MSDTARNKQVMIEIYDALAKGDGSKFVAAMAEDFTWIMRGTTAWSGTYRGKEAVVAQVTGPLFAQFVTQYTNTLRRLTAEGDIVVVECKGDVMTRRGVRYDNDYCYVIRMRDGQMVELTEYFDTQLVDRALDPPETSLAAVR